MNTGLNKKNLPWDVLCALPGIFFLLSILIVRLHDFSMPMTDVYWSEAKDTSTLSDLFTYWKAIMILFSALLAVVVVVACYFHGRIHFRKSIFLVPLVVYLGFSLLSSFFSDYRYFAIRGMHEHFEGVGVICAYMFMLLFLSFALDNTRKVRIILYTALICAGLLGVLGITQATGHDFLSTVAGQKLITPNTMNASGVSNWELIDVLSKAGGRMYNFTFQSGEVYQTVYNINYVPFYLTLLIPLAAVFFIYHFYDTKPSHKVFSVVFLAVFGLLVYNFFAANSASGYFGLLAIFVVALIVFHKELKKWIKPILCLIVVLGLVMGLLADRWLPEVKELVGSMVDHITAYVYAEDIVPSAEDFKNAPASVWIPIDSIETANDHVNFSINGSTIVIARDKAQGAFTITDESGKPLYLTKIDGKDGDFQVLDERFHDYVILSLVRAEDGMVVNVTTKETNWYFLYDGNGFRYANKVGKYVDLNPVPHSGLIKDYSFGSYRGRIWATAIPMLKHHLLLGAGADCFTFAFPQNDYVTLYNQFEGKSLNLVTDKAHNLYMQYWVNTGLISLLAWLAMVCMYLMGAVKYFKKHGFVTFVDYVNGGIFCGIIGFLATAFFNDGSVNTMPMFYTMLGTGFAINTSDQWVKTEDSGISAPAQMPEI